MSPYLDGRAPIEPTTGYGTPVIHPHLSDWLFENKWTAKEFAVPGEGLPNVGGTGWVGGVSQVTENTTDPMPDLWQQTSLWNYQIEQGWIGAPRTDGLPSLDAREVDQPIGHQAIFYPTELLIDYGAWITQIYPDKQGISAFEDLGNYTYRAKHYYPPVNLSMNKLGSTLAGWKSRGDLL